MLISTKTPVSAKPEAIGQIRILSLEIKQNSHQHTIDASAEARPSMIALAALMPHPPILIPEIGKGRLHEVNNTLLAMRKLAAQMEAFKPDLLIVLSPHSIREPGRFAVWKPNPLLGDFSDFGAPQVGINLPNGLAFAQALEVELQGTSLDYESISHSPLDHGACVPLYFLQEAGWQSNTVVIGIPHLPAAVLAGLGQTVRHIAIRRKLRLGIIASGDMSHRLLPGAPGGFSPAGQAFDDQFVQILKSNQWPHLQNLPPTLRREAAEDVIDPTLVALSILNQSPDQTSKLLSYEGPFGVGYAVAVLGGSS